ncbi:MAG: hypothetical protein E6Z86_02770 [Clostridium butyricum]|nr:hypothetical protein [Clostridium butyricum]MDU5818869.1 hypothetical protein [Clostridium butyricum]
MYDDYESDGFNDEWSDEYDYFSEPPEYEERSYKETFREDTCYSEYYNNREKYEAMQLEEILNLDIPIEKKLLLYIGRKYGVLAIGTIEKRWIDSKRAEYSIKLIGGVYGCPTMFESKLEFSKYEECVYSTLLKTGQLEINDIKSIRKLDTETFMDLNNKLKEKFKFKSDNKLTYNAKTNTINFYLPEILYVSDCDNIKTSLSLEADGYQKTMFEILNPSDINFVYNLEKYLALVKKVNLENTNLEKGLYIFQNLEPRYCIKNINGEYEIHCELKTDYTNKYIKSVNVKYYNEHYFQVIYTVTEENLRILSKYPPLS